jgi:PAS domain S-box-containing protein
MEGFRGKKREPKWHLIYYVLAAFDLLTISGSLLLNHEIMQVYTGSVEMNKELSDIQGRFIDLGRLASVVNAPGNDVFDSGDVAAEHARRDIALRRFERSLAILRSEVQERLEPADAPPLVERLDEIETAMGAMIAESDRIFALFHQKKTEEAGHRMATMDRTYARVTNSVADASSQVRDLQSQRFHEQLASAASLRKFEYLIGGVVALIVCLVALYGHMIARRLKQVQAEALNTRLGRIVEDSINEIYVFDAETFRFLQVNRGARENLGYSIEELYALTPLDLNPELSQQKAVMLLEPLRDGSRDQIVMDAIHRRKDGSTYDVEVHLQLARTETPPVFVAIAQDITDMRANEEKLLQAQKMNAVGQLTGGVAHDFNNLLTEITGNLELLEEQVKGQEQRKLIAETQEAAGLGAKLTRDLLAFARRQPLAPKVFDLNALVKDMQDWLRRTLDETIEIRMVLADDLGMAMADPAQLKNAVLNLALNARDAMPKGGVLTIETASETLDQHGDGGRAGVFPRRHVMLSITDTGIGMASEVRDQAFEPFFTTKEAKAGSGLGLSMVYGFAKQSGGHVELLSKPGWGTSVKLYLPQTGAGAGMTAMEDEPAGATGELASTGQCVLVVEMKHRWPDIGILFTSGYTSEAAVSKGLLDQSARLLAKPYSRDELIHGIRSTLEDKTRNVVSIRSRRRNAPEPH